MNLKKELLEFVEANNWFSLEDRKNAEGVIDSYLKSYNKQLTIQSVLLQSEQFSLIDIYKIAQGYTEEQFIEMVNHIQG